MPKPVKVKVLFKGRYLKADGDYSLALVDVKVGKTYEALLYEKGEINNGVVATHREVSFIDEVGDRTNPHVHPDRMEVTDA